MTALALVSLAASAAAGHLLICRTLRLPQMQKKNFAGEMIPCAYGAYIALYACIGCLAAVKLRVTPHEVGGLYLATVSGMALLGLMDDAFGSRHAGGFKGHFKKLLLEHELTTGAVKAIGGGILALVVGFSISRNLPQGLLNALLIALSANALNLLDLRPGRALGAFAVGLITVMAVVGSRSDVILPLAALTIPALALAKSDVTGRAMMGDTGSNPLGASLGLTLALSGNIAAKLTAAALLLALHLLCEKYSLTQIIEKSVILKKIDSHLGVR